MTVKLIEGWPGGPFWTSDGMTRVRAIDGPHAGNTFTIQNPLADWEIGVSQRPTKAETQIYWIVNGPQWHAYTLEAFTGHGWALRFRDTFDAPRGKTLCTNYYGEY